MQLAHVVIPDDYPPVLRPSKAYPSLAERCTLGYFDSLPGSSDRLIERIRHADAVLNIRSSVRFPEDVFRACPKMRLLSIWGTGTDNVDLAAAARHGVTVTNTPGVAAASIAEHSLALLLAVARRIPRLDLEVRQGLWPRGSLVQLEGKTLGILGLGAIGRRFAQMASALGMKVVAWTFHPDPALGITLLDRDELLRNSDFISVHLRLTPETRGLVGSREFSLMKPAVILINTARGAIVDEPSLVAALAEHRIAGAGLDVYASEPLAPGHILTQLDNVVLTPHCAGATPEVLEAGLQLAVDNIFSFFSGRSMNVVAAPGA